MKLRYATALLAIVGPWAPAIAQQNSGDGSLPESLRIQQNVEQQNTNNSNTPTNGDSSRTTTEAPGGSSGPVEMNRIDPSAPSSHRLQIDDGTSAAVRQNPDVNALHPGSSGTSYNTILRGGPSTSGAGTGTSGIGSAGRSGGIGSGGAGASGASGGAAGGGR